MKALGLVVAAIVLLLVGGVGGRFVGAGAAPPPPLPTLVPSQVTTLTGPGVLKRIQKLNRLEAASFKVETVVTAEKAGTWWKGWQDGQSAIVLVSGNVVAGIDLSELKANDVQVTNNGTSARVTLPPAKIFSSNLEQTRTYNYETGLFGTINLDPALLEQAQNDGRVKIQETACASDILKIATENGQTSVENLLNMLDFQDVEVVASPIPGCPTTVTP